MITDLHPELPDDGALTHEGLAPSRGGRVLLLACGALAREIVALRRMNGWDHLDLACLPANLHLWPDRIPDAVAEAVARHRDSYEKVFVVYADLCGEENGLTYGGRSVILGPDGDELARAGMRETLIVAEIDPTAYDDARAQNPYLTDRRPGLYRLG